MVKTKLEKQLLKSMKAKLAEMSDLLLDDLIDAIAFEQTRRLDAGLSDTITLTEKKTFTRVKTKEADNG